MLESFINVAQIEITGRCNLKCKHCRGSASKNNMTDMPLEKIIEIVNFAKDNSDNGFVEVVLSGGEPLLHSDITQIIAYCLKENVYTEITTNGLLINSEFTNAIKNNKLVTISVSIDSCNSALHDSFRGMNGAYDKAINGIKMLVENGVRTRIRSTVSKNNLDEMERLILLAEALNVDSIAFGPIIPVGNAMELKKEMFNTPAEMKNFIETFYALKEKYKNRIHVVTNECLHILHDYKDLSEGSSEERVLDGCSAGIVSFNVLINGDVTPCSMFHKKIFNVYESTNYTEDYIQSSLLKNLIVRNYTGKCGRCALKDSCGGCRVRAEYYRGSYLDSDPLCWV